LNYFQASSFSPLIRLNSRRGLELDDRALVRQRPRWWCGKVASIGKFFGKVACDLDKRVEPGHRHRLEYHRIALFFDHNFSAFKAKGTRQADGLAASMLEYLGGDRGYKLYLFSPVVKR